MDLRLSTPGIILLAVPGCSAPNAYFASRQPRAIANVNGPWCLSMSSTREALHTQRTYVQQRPTNRRSASTPQFRPATAREAETQERRSAS